MKLKPTTWLWVLIGLYALVFAGVSCLRHYQFQTQTWDLGVFTQTFWNTIHGHIMANHLEEAPNHLGVHMAPWLFVLVPGYAIFPSPYYLLLIQTLALALGAWPLFLLAKKVLNDEKWALLLAGCYLLYPTLEWLNVFDFHEEPFFVPLLIAAFYFVEIKKFGWAGLFFALAASTKENSILVVAAAGIYLFVRSHKKFGILITILALGYFFLSVKVIMPALGGGLLRIDRYANLGATPTDIVQNVIHHPALLVHTIFVAKKISYVLWLFLPVAFLPVSSLSSLLLVIPGLAQNLLTLFEYQFTGLYQYDGIILPGIWIGTIYGLANLLKKWPSGKLMVKRVLLSVAILAFLLRSPISPLHFPKALFIASPRAQAFREMVKFVPPQAAVAAHTNLVPHLSNREFAFMLGKESFPVDVVLMDSRDSFGFPDEATFQAYYDNYAKSPDYVQKIIQNRYVIFQRKSLLQMPHESK